MHAKFLISWQKLIVHFSIWSLAWVNRLVCLSKIWNLCQQCWENVWIVFEIAFAHWVETVVCNKAHFLLPSPSFAGKIKMWTIANSLRILQIQFQQGNDNRLETNSSKDLKWIAFWPICYLDLWNCKLTYWKDMILL